MSTTPGTQPRVRGRVRVEQGAKRIRAYLGGELVAESARPLLVWEKPYYPTYYLPLADVRMDILQARVERAPATLTKGGRFSLAGVVININGVTDPAEVARRVAAILKQGGKHKTPQTRGA